MRRAPTILGILLCLVLPALVAGRDDPEDAQSSELTLEKLFPKKSFFGPSARSSAFSHDGSHGSYLYRPYLERRHGNDLWILDTNSGDVERVTRVSILAEFQESTRRVRDHRKEKAEKARKKSTEDEKGESEEKKTIDAPDDEKLEEEELGDLVTGDDAEDEKAPRYSGVSSYTWSPTANELLFTSEGDIFRYEVSTRTVTRLTKTRDRERSVAYLPDGSGYSYMRGDALLRVSFGQHTIEQLDPRLPGGETVSRYKVSPDGQRIALVTRRPVGPKPTPRSVNVMSYKDRFAKVRQVPREVSEDERQKSEVGIYLYQPKDLLREDYDLVSVFTTTSTAPRDTVSAPEWAPDSSRVSFTVFDQESELVQVLEAVFPEEDELAKIREARAKPSEDAKKKAGESDEKKQRARVVYRFLHGGGPNTPRMMQPRYIHDSRRLVLVTEQSGFRHLHILDPLYESLDQLTRGRYEVYPISISKDHRWLFFTATKENPARQDVYRMRLEDGVVERLSRGSGVYRGVAVSEDGQQFLASFTCYGQLRELVYGTMNSPQRNLTDSHPEIAKELTRPVPEFFTFQNRHGHDIQGMMFRPEGHTTDDRRPLLVYVYGGPLGTSKTVTDGSYSSASYFFAYYMAQKHGYVTCSIDPRGQSGYGALFEKANFEQVGRPQVEDLVDAVRWMIDKQGVDAKRVGIHGWSFGGFQTQMCLYTEPKVFACGIAGAGPTEWENYNSWYSTATIGNTRTGKPDLKKFSLLPLAKNLEGKLLLVHGMEDTNVLYQDTVRVYRELLKAGKETLVDLFLDPTGGHGLGGEVKNVNRYRKYEEFLLRTLGEGEAESGGPVRMAL